MRTLQFLPYLRNLGWTVEVAPFLDNSYVTSLYGGHTLRRHVAKAYARRLRKLGGVAGFNVVWIEKEALPWLPAWVERFWLKKAAHVVVDYDDAMFHRYDHHRRSIVRRVLGGKIDRVMATADAVVVGNEYLANRAAAAGAKRIEWVPTVIDVDRYPSCDRTPSPGIPVIGWIGSPDTVRFLAPIFGVANAIAASRNVRFVAIGARRDQLEGSPFEAVPWSAAEEVESLSALDIGIMPLQDTPWQRGKCGYKLIQYMACGLPVVASPVGVNRNLVYHGRNGFLAATEEEWKAALMALLDSAELRKTMGERGRKMTTEVYTLQRQSPRIAEILESVTRGQLTQ